MGRSFSAEPRSSGSNPKRPSRERRSSYEDSRSSSTEPRHKQPSGSNPKRPSHPLSILRKTHPCYIQSRPKKRVRLKPQAVPPKKGCNWKFWALVVTVVFLILAAVNVLVLSTTSRGNADAPGKPKPKSTPKKNKPTLLHLDHDDSKTWASDKSIKKNSKTKPSKVKIPTKTKKNRGKPYEMKVMVFPHSPEWK